MRLQTRLLPLAVLFCVGCSDSTAPGSSGGTPPLHFFAIAVGEQRSCGLAVDSTAWCWGEGAGISFRPRSAFAGAGYRALSVGASIWGDPAVCVMSSTGSVICDGQLDVNADGALMFRAPDPLPGGVPLTQFSVGKGQICGRDASGVGYCWGDFESGVRGLASIGFDTSYATTTPNVIDGGHVWAQIVAGDWHTCGLDQAGAAWCWGANILGQLGSPGDTTLIACGLGPSPCVKAPVAVAGGHTFTALAAGGDHTCGLTAAGAIYCWGSNSKGELGNSSTDLCDGTFYIHCARSPILVYNEALPPFKAITAGLSHTCALGADSLAYCWGDDSFGQLGTGGGAAGIPVSTKGEQHFMALAAGYSHTCALALDGTAWCWGNNANGQLGTGSAGDSDVPVPVVGP